MTTRAAVLAVTGSGLPPGPIDVHAAVSALAASSVRLAMVRLTGRVPATTGTRRRESGASPVPDLGAPN
jgi:hypothetical protein